MKNFVITFNLVLFLILFTGCETIKKKSDEIVEKENAKFHSVDELLTSGDTWEVKE